MKYELGLGKPFSKKSPTHKTEKQIKVKLPHVNKHSRQIARTTA